MYKDFLEEKSIKYVDHKDTHLLERFINSHGKILPRARTKLTDKNQKKVVNAIKRARILALIPFIAE